MKKVLIVTLLFFGATYVLGVTERVTKPKQLPPVYDITVGGERFVVPSAYVHSRGNKRHGEHKFFTLLARIPSFEPVEGATTSVVTWSQSEDDIKISLSGGDLALDRAIERSVERETELNYPENYGQEGFYSLGYTTIEGKRFNDIHVFKKNDTIHAIIRCTPPKAVDRPGCLITQEYIDNVSLRISFDIHHLDWYREIGINSIPKKMNVFKFPKS